MVNTIQSWDSHCVGLVWRLGNNSISEPMRRKRHRELGIGSCSQWCLPITPLIDQNNLTLYYISHKNLKLFFHLFIVWWGKRDIHACMSWNMYGSQRIACRTWFSPYTMWDPGIRLKSSELLTSVFTLQAISLAPCHFKLQCIIQVPQTNVHSQCVSSNRCLCNHRQSQEQE